jgi:hypothetical protein
MMRVWALALCGGQRPDSQPPPRPLLPHPVWTAPLTHAGWRRLYSKRSWPAGGFGFNGVLWLSGDLTLMSRYGRWLGFLQPSTHQRKVPGGGRVQALAFAGRQYARKHLITTPTLKLGGASRCAGFKTLTRKHKLSHWAQHGTP